MNNWAQKITEDILSMLYNRRQWLKVYIYKFTNLMYILSFSYNQKISEKLICYKKWKMKNTWMVSDKIKFIPNQKMNQIKQIDDFSNIFHQDTW